MNLTQLHAAQSEGLHGSDATELVSLSSGTSMEGQSMTAITTTTMTRDELESRRAAILRALGMSMDELAERRHSGSMSADEWEAWEELDGIDYLIG
jgi:hypothetical protein